MSTRERIQVNSGVGSKDRSYRSSCTELSHEFKRYGGSCQSAMLGRRLSQLVTLTGPMRRNILTASGRLIIAGQGFLRPHQDASDLRPLTRNTQPLKGEYYEFQTTIFPLWTVRWYWRG